MESMCLKELPAMRDPELDLWKIPAYRSSRGIKTGPGDSLEILIFDDYGEPCWVYRQNSGKRELLLPGSAGYDESIGRWNRELEFYRTVAPRWAAKLADEYPQYAMDILRNANPFNEPDMLDWLQLRLG